jgi:hypothetical protein
LFNTLLQTATGLQPQHDLWRINIQTGETRPLLEAGEGGSFSPNLQTVATIYPGTYGEPNGRIRLLDMHTLEWRDALTFTGVSTGTESPFYPEVFWEDDSSALRVALPDKDLIYDDVNGPPTALWLLPVDGDGEQIGSVPASFFGQPRWSSDGTSLTYLQRVGEATSNQFALMVADGNGQNAVQYAMGEAGNIGSPVWVRGEQVFVYAFEAPGTIWIGSVKDAPRLLGENLINLQFVDSRTYFYASNLGNGFELRYARLDEVEMVKFATLHDGLPLYDARVVD